MDQSNESIIQKIDSLFQFGWTPFLIHAREGDACTVQRLICDDTNINSRNIYGLSALTVSVFSNNESTVKSILHAPNFEYNASAKELIDPVSLASLLGFKNILLVLLERLPHLVNNIIPFSNYTPIFFAGIRRHYNIVRILIERGANLHLRNSAQQTILDIAIMMTDAELVSLLSSKTGKESRRPIAQPNAFTPPRCLGSNSIHYSPCTPKNQSREMTVSPMVTTPRLNFNKKNSKSPVHRGKSPLLGLRTKLPLSERNENTEPSNGHRHLSGSPYLPRTPSRFDTFKGFLHEQNDVMKTSNERSALSDSSFLPQTPSQFDNSNGRFSWSLNFENFTPDAESSIAFRPSIGSRNSTFASSNASFGATPKLLGYASLGSPMVNRANSEQSPYIPSPSCSYHHFPSPNFSELLPNNGLAKNCPSPCCRQKFNREVLCTPSHHAPSRLSKEESSVDSFATPMKFRIKKGFLRKKLLTKLCKRKNTISDENSVPESQDLDSVLNTLGLQNYKLFFEVNEVEPELLHTCTDSDLRSMGIDDKKVRQLILKRIQKKLL